MQRDIEMKFCNQWQSHISTVWDQTLSSKRTTLTPTERGLSKTTPRIWEWRGWNGLPAVLTSTPLCDQLGCAVHARMTNTTTLVDMSQMLVKEWDAIPQQCVTRLVTSTRRRCQAVVAVYVFFHTLLRLLFVK